MALYIYVYVSFAFDVKKKVSLASLAPRLHVTLNGR